MFPGLADPALYRYLSDLPPIDAAQTAAWFRQSARGMSPDGRDRWCSWAIRHDADGRCLGTVQATIPLHPDQGRRALLGYMIFPAVWRRGFGREAISAMLDFLFDTGRCMAADAVVDTRNDPSLALLAGLGFTTIRHVADADWFAGSTSHEYELSLTAAAWRERART